MTATKQTTYHSVHVYRLSLGAWTFHCDAHPWISHKLLEWPSWVEAFAVARKHAKVAQCDRMLNLARRNP